MAIPGTGKAPPNSLTKSLLKGSSITKKCNLPTPWGEPRIGPLPFLVPMHMRAWGKNCISASEDDRNSFLVPKC